MRPFISQRAVSQFVLVFLFMAVNAWQTSALSIQDTWHKYISCIDGKGDNYALIPGKNNTLIVYLHSFTDDFTEPFKGDANLADAILKQYPGASFVSLNYGNTASWGSAAARLDITNNLRSIIKDLHIDKIILVGVSMGASTALTYVATAPSYIKEKIIGIIAVSPYANLEDLYKQSASPVVKTALENIFGDNPGLLSIASQQNSFDSCLAFFPLKTKVGVISGNEDKVIPIDLQKDVLRDLNNRNITVKLFEIDGAIEAIPVKSILEAFCFVNE